MAVCDIWENKPAKYFTDDLDLIIDNKKWAAPTNERAQRYVKQQRVRGHLRTPAEGVKKNFTKPSTKKHRMNTGARILSNISSWMACADL